MPLPRPLPGPITPCAPLYHYVPCLTQKGKQRLPKVKCLPQGHSHMLSMVGRSRRGPGPSWWGTGVGRGWARPGACQTRWSRTSPAAPSRPGPAPWWESLASWCFCPRCRLPAGALTDKSLTLPWGEAQEGVEGSWTQIAKGKVPSPCQPNPRAQKFKI